MEKREEKSWKKPEKYSGNSGTHCSASEEQNKSGKLFTGKLQALPKQLQELKKECDVILIEAGADGRLPLNFRAAWEPVIPEMTRSSNQAVIRLNSEKQSKTQFTDRNQRQNFWVNLQRKRLRRKISYGLQSQTRDFVSPWDAEDFECF